MHHTPYTTQVLDAVMAAQLGIGCLIFAMLWFYGVGVRPIGSLGDGPNGSDPRVASLQATCSFVLLTAALAVVTTAPVLGDVLRSFEMTLSPTFLEKLLHLALVFGTMAAVLSGRWEPVMGVLVGDALLYKMPSWFPSSEGEITALYLIAIALLVTALRPPPALRTARSVELLPPSYDIAETHDRRQDIALFVIGTVMGALVCTFVMIRRGGSGDEWAYTWQAAMFGHLKPYGVAPPCGNALQTFYVFSHLGRSFVQYTPGWPMLMAPFSLLGVVWMASPVSAGFLGVAIARLSRRAAASMLDHEDPRVVTAAGWIGGLSITFGTTYMLNAGSRYAHVPTMALFAWSLEAVLWLNEHPLTAKHRGRWGALLGSCVALAGAARPADGAILELSVGAIFFYALVRRRIGWRAFLTTTAGVAFFGGLTLVILRLQLGTWFTTGYSLNVIIHPWNVVRYTMPRPDEWKYSVPLATGAYCWFPCSLAIGIAGLCTLRRAGALISWGMTSMVPLLGYYSIVDMGSRGRDWGYGPRYSLALMVPMAVGTAAILAPMAVAAMRRVDEREGLLGHERLSRLSRLGGPWTLAVSAMIIGTVRITPLLWPGIHSFLESHGKVTLGIERQNVHHAVVFVGKDTSEWDILDATENLPFDLVPNPDVVIAIDRTPELTQCVKARFPGRTYLRARRGPIDISLEPF